MEIELNNDKIIKREYDWDDFQMLERAKHFYETFSEDLSQFEKTFNFFDLKFKNQFYEVLEKANTFPTDSEVSQEISSINSDLDILMGEAKKEVQKFFTIVRLIFGKGPILKQMGKSEYEKARNSIPLMLKLLENIYKMATQNEINTELLSNGISTEEINRLQIIIEGIKEKIVNKDNAKQLRQSKTIERIHCYNEVWNFLEKISNASKIIFKTDNQKIKEYLLYPSIDKLPERVENLSIDYKSKIINWNISPNAVEYELSYKPVDGSTDWLLCYSGEETHTKHSPGMGEWLYRCRGKNSYGVGYWSEKVSTEYRVI